LESDPGYLPISLAEKFSRVEIDKSVRADGATLSMDFNPWADQGGPRVSRQSLRQGNIAVIKKTYGRRAASCWL